MANSQYLELCQLRFAHPYYDKSVTNDISLEPTPASAQLMRKYDIRLHERDGSLHLYYRYSDHSQQSIQELLQQEGSKLSFRIKTTNSYFYGFTALPEQLSGQPILFDHCGFYFHNRTAIQSSDDLVISGRAPNEMQQKFAQMSQAGSEPIVDGHVNIGDLYWRLEALPYWVELPVPETSEDEREEITKVVTIGVPETEDLTFKLRWYAPQQLWGWAEYVPPNNLAPGLYEATIEDLPTIAVLWDPQLNSTTDLGLLELFLGPQGEEAATISTEEGDPHKAIPPTYRLQWLNRRVFARYQLIVRSDEGDFPAAENIQVQAVGPPAITFSQAKETEQSSKEKRYQTISNELVPIVEQPAKGQYPSLQIADFPALADGITLPLPNYQNIRVERTETEDDTDKSAPKQVTYFADTYVYL